MVIGYHAQGLLGAGLAGLAMFVPTAVLTAVVARHWSRLRGRPWALTVERTLAPIGIGLMAGGVYTLARSAIHDARSAVIAAAAALLLATGRVPPIVVIVAAGLAGWLLARG
jgi:chromate transporter